MVRAAGGSARREYERRSARELARQQKAADEDEAWRERIRRERPVLGRVASALKPRPVVGVESQATKAWEVGAGGEERVAAVLTACPGVVVVHDCRVPGTKANIDHIAIGPGGVFVIDTKRYTGAVEKRDLGGWLRTDERLYVGGRDRTKLVEAMAHQVEVVNRVIDAASTGVGALPVLCFVDADWPRVFARSLVVRSVMVTWPADLAKRLVAPARLGPATVAELAAAVEEGLPPA